MFSDVLHFFIKSSEVCFYDMAFIFLVTSLGYCWQYGEVQVKSAYVYRSEEEISGTLGIFVGLRRINITLTGTTIYLTICRLCLCSYK